ncbi:MAG: hypothetical protein U9R25_08390 [Chloroflexota bacterium]|nr:hypothetical protein [Chloroflexota bacterium]
MPYLEIPRQKSVKTLQHPLDDNEAKALLSHLHGRDYLLAAIMYGAGLRVKETAFPSQRLSRHRREPDNTTLYRFHVSPNLVSRSVKSAAQAAGIDKRVTPHILRHSFAVPTRLPRPETGLPNIQ